MAIVLLLPLTAMSAAAGAAPAVTTSAAITSKTYTVPPGIAHDCSTDVTPALMAWFKSVPDNSVLQFGAGACYEIENVLFIAGRHLLTFDGNGATFRAKTDGASQTPPAGVTNQNWPRRRAHWWVQGSTDITLTKMNIVGANPYTGLADAQYNPKYEVQSGLVVNASTRVTLVNSTISKVWGDFVTLEGNSRNVTVYNNRMTTSGRQGIAITNASQVAVVANTLDDVSWGMFDLEPNFATTVLDDIRILYNLTGTARWNWFSSWGVSTSVRNIVVEHNKVTGQNNTLVFVRNRTPEEGLRGPFSIAYNDFVFGWSSLAAVELYGAKQVSIHDNIVRNLAGTANTMVRASGSDQLQVQHNDFTVAARILQQGDTPTWCEADNKPAALSQNKPC